MEIQMSDRDAAFAKIAMRWFLDAVPKLVEGDRVGQWVLLKYVPSTKEQQSSNPHWLCRCDCGNVRLVRVTNLVSNGSNASRSCGHNR